MPEYKCSMCDYKSSVRGHILRHISKKNRCSDDINKLSVIEIKMEIKCEYCNKLYTFKSNLHRHQKTCENKKENYEEEIKNLKEKLATVEAICKDLCDINKKYEELKKINEKNEKIIDSIVKTATKKILGNTPVETIRSQARKKYKDLFKNMKCVHCKHEGSTQVCHIKAISEFDKFSEVEEINKMSNLIGLCPNCHIDLDKHKKFEVVRTSMLHSMLIHC